MALSDYIPSFNRPKSSLEAGLPSGELDAGDIKVLKNLFKPLPLALGFNGSAGGYTTKHDFEVPEWNFGRITNAINSDSYAQQAFAKYQELFWKEGWTIVSENPEARDYLQHRIDIMEMVMGKSFQELLSEASDQLFKYHNVFLTKVRQDIRPYFDGTLQRGEKETIAAYGMIPTEYVEIKRDRYNNPKQYRQRLSDTGIFNGFRGQPMEPSWNPDEVVHMARKRPPGKIFGTPFMVAVLEDLISLRQIEEDILNLIHRELFPFYVYKVGNDTYIPDPDDVANAHRELEALRTEAGLVIPGINSVEVVGADGNALDANPYLGHFKERVAIGLGIYPHHLGMSGSSANRSMTDRLDVMLYDKIKEYQRYFADAVRINIFNELLLEGGFDPIASISRTGVSDRCEFKFNEIDVDTQIKKESHLVQLANSNLITIPEARVGLKRDPELEEAETVMAMGVRLQPNQVVTSGEGPPTSVDNTPPAAKKPNTQEPSKGGRPNTPNKRKGVGNIVRPTNQHGTRNSPGVRRSDDLDLWKEVAEMLHEGEKRDSLDSIPDLNEVYDERQEGQI